MDTYLRNNKYFGDIGEKLEKQASSLKVEREKTPIKMYLPTRGRKNTGILRSSSPKTPTTPTKTPNESPKRIRLINDDGFEDKEIVEIPAREEKVMVDGGCDPAPGGRPELAIKYKGTVLNCSGNVCPRNIYKSHKDYPAMVERKYKTMVEKFSRPTLGMRKKMKSMNEILEKNKDMKALEQALKDSRKQTDLIRDSIIFKVHSTKDDEKIECGKK